MHALDGPKLKLAVAHEEIEKLDSLFCSFISDRTIHGFTRKIDPETKEQVFIARATQDPDLKWGVQIGNIAHMIRSALDNLACALADLSSRGSDDQTAYPIRLCKANEPDGFGITIKKKGNNAGREFGPLGGVHARHRAMIERAQPYFSGNLGRSDPLWQLQRLNITDKHRTITVMRRACAMTKTRSTITDDRLIQTTWNRELGLPFEDGAEITREDREVCVGESITGYISFGDSCPETSKHPVSDTLEDMHVRVAQIIDMFDGEFT